MNKPHYSPEYIEHRQQGPFPTQMDPWSEAGRYFQQIHADIISNLLTQIRQPVLELGYEAGREASLLVAERREPDIHVRYQDDPPPVITTLDYAAAATEIMAEAGLGVEGELFDENALHIRQMDSGDLVTIVEIVSPRNKTERSDMTEYRERRDRYLRRGIHIMEIDLTRSIKRLLQDFLTTTYAYHIAVYIPKRPARIIGVDFGKSLKRVALPLQNEVVPMELQSAYDFAYRQNSIAGQLFKDHQYHVDELPFPSLLTADERKNALQAVETWKAELERLRS